MFNISKIIAAAEAFLAKAETIAPEALSFVDEARKAASAVGLLTPEREQAIAVEVHRLTGSVDALTPVATAVVGDAAAFAKRGTALADALVGHLQQVQGTSTTAGTTTGSIVTETHGVTISASPLAPPAAPAAEETAPAAEAPAAEPAKTEAPPAAKEPPVESDGMS